MSPDLQPDVSSMKTIIFNIIFLSNLVGAQGLTYKTLGACQKDYAEIFAVQNDNINSVAELPAGVYLARSVTQSLEKTNEKYFSYQTLLTDSKNSADVCYKGAPSSSLKTQAFIPTVIDRTTSKKLGHTFWSLSAVLDKLTGAIQSKRSLIPSENYRKALENQGYKIASFQKTHNEFQLRLERNIASWKEIIVISYDQF